MLSEALLSPCSETPVPLVLPIDMDDAELDDLFASCMPRLQQMARQMLQNHEDSEDALQEGLLSAFRNLRQFQGRSKFSSWLYIIVKNAARTQVRTRKSRPQYVSEEEFANVADSALEEISVDRGPSPEEECARRERSRFLLEALQDMPPRYQAAVHLCDVDGVAAKDAAQMLGMTSSALKTSLFRARRLAARRIRERISAANETSPRNDCHPVQGGQISQIRRKGGTVLNPKRIEWKRSPMRARARKKLDHVGSNYETRRKRTRFWKHPLPFPVYNALRDSLQPTC